MKNLENIGGIIVAIIGAIIAVLVVLRIVAKFIKAGKDGDKATQMEILKQILFSLVTEAERALGGGTGKLKLSTVIRWVYEHIPDNIKGLFTLDDITDLIEDVLDDAQTYWEENDNAHDYIESGTATAEVLEASPIFPTFSIDIGGATFPDDVKINVDDVAKKVTETVAACVEDAVKKAKELADVTEVHICDNAIPEIHGEVGLIVNPGDADAADVIKWPQEGKDVKEPIPVPETSQGKAVATEEPPKE